MSRNKTIKIREDRVLIKELETLFTLHKIEQEALMLCYEENKDIGHIFALDTIFSDRFSSLLNMLQNYNRE